MVGLFQQPFLHAVVQFIVVWHIVAAVVGVVVVVAHVCVAALPLLWYVVFVVVGGVTLIWLRLACVGALVAQHRSSAMDV